MKIKQTHKPAILSAMAAAVLYLGGGLPAHSQQVLTNAFYGPNSPAPNTGAGFNYLVNGIIGDTNWDGVYLFSGDIPYGPGYGLATSSAGGVLAASLTANTFSSANIPPLNSALPNPPTEALAVQATESEFGGQIADGFFIYKVVTGDFDMAVRSLPLPSLPGGTGLYAGLMVRPWNTNNTGAPMDVNTTNHYENYLNLSRVQSAAGGTFTQTNPFVGLPGSTSSIVGGDEIRITTNGFSLGFTEEEFPDAELTNVVTQPEEASAYLNEGINETRMYRIVRHQLTNFTFYVATNLGDPWTLITNAGTTRASRGYTTNTGTVVRPDFTNVLFQAGIAYGCDGVTSDHVVYFDSFQIVGTNLNLSSTKLSTPASNLVVSNANTNGNVTLTWTPGTNLDGSTANSLVIVRQDLGNIICTPISGAPLPLADTNLAHVYASTNQNNAQFGASNNIVVYEGSGTNVTISGTLNPNHIYNVAVFSYTNSSSGPIFNTAIGSSTATNSFTGPGVVVGITATVYPTNVPVGGVGAATVIAQYSTGDSVNITTNPSITITSADPAIVVNNGILNAVALTAGTPNPNISISYSPFLANINVASHTPVFFDYFNTPHSYLTNGVIGSTWDGVYETNTDIAGVVLGGSPLAMTAFDADITSNNCLTVSSANGYWKAADDNGPFLYKIVAGDFQASVHVTGYGLAGGGGSNAVIGAGQVAYEFQGLMARAFASSNNASAFGTGRSEDFVNWMRFDQFGDTSVLFQTINGATTEFDDGAESVGSIEGETTGDWWLLMTRSQGTNFGLLKSYAQFGPWTLVHSVVQPALTNGVPVQVGLEQGSYTGNVGIAQFDTFMLDATNLVGAAYTPAVVPTPASGMTIVLTNGDSQAVITWTAGTIPGGGTPTSFIVMRAGSPITSQPYFGDLTTASAVFGAGTDLGGGNYCVFRGGALGLNSTIVTGLQPGIVYYVSIYEYAGSSSTKAFNEAGGSNAVASTPPVVFSGLTAIASSGTGIPANGIGGSYHVFAGIQGTTNTIDVSTTATLSSPGGIVAGANGIFTGLKAGTDANVTFSFTPPNSPPMTTAAVSVTVRNATYHDNFAGPINYLALAEAGPGATAGTIWDGVFLGGTGAPTGYSIPGGDPGAGIVTALDAGITATNTLTLVHSGDNWGPAGVNDGFLLYKNVVGDFQASVFVTNMTIVDDQMSGIMVRAATYTGAASSGVAGSENFVSDNEFEQFNFVDVNRAEVNGADNQLTGPSTTGSNGFLVVRSQGTNFNFYRRNGPSNAFVFIPNFTRALANFTNTQLVEVGPNSACYGGTSGTTGFTQFMLDLSTGPVLTVSIAGGNITLTWDASDTFQHVYSSSTVPAQFTLTSIAVTTVNGISTAVVPIGAGNKFYEVGP